MTETDRAEPEHIAVIMDGNGRWATDRGLPRVEGHRRGAESIRAITTECARLEHVQQLTLYALSTENFRARPRHEVKFLERLLWRFLRNELKLMMDNSVRFTTIGDTSVFPLFVRRKIDQTREKTAGNTRLTLCIAINYGARDEIVRAARSVATEAAEGRLDAASLDEAGFAAHLDTAGMTDPDLLIRTAGEMRISNFLLWQCSYSEFYSTETLWPDFREPHLHQAIDDYAHRRRTYGGLKNRR